jgi:hypothetical protein
MAFFLLISKRGVGLVYVETLSDNEGKKKAKRQDLTPLPLAQKHGSEK